MCLFQVEELFYEIAFWFVGPGYASDKNIELVPAIEFLHSSLVVTSIVSMTSLQPSVACTDGLRHRPVLRENRSDPITHANMPSL